MDYDYIENLVKHAKLSSPEAKAALTQEFTPFINSISSRIYINGYERNDLKNECYLTLFNCIAKYNLDHHRFVAYASNAIKNNLNILLKKVLSKEEFDGYFSLCDDFEGAISCDNSFIIEKILLQNEHQKLISVIKDNLDASEKQLINFLFFKKNTLTNYAYYENISYVTASKRKKKVLEKLNTLLKRA